MNLTAAQNWRVQHDGADVATGGVVHVAPNCAFSASAVLACGGIIEGYTP